MFERIRKKKPRNLKQGGAFKNLLRGDTMAGIFELRDNKDGQIISTGYQIYNPDSFYQSSPSFCSPQLLCSGAVLRYQFKPYQKPIRRYPPSRLVWTPLNLVTLLAPCSDPLRVKAPTT